MSQAVVSAGSPGPVTGTLVKYKRKDIEKLITDLGGKRVGSVTKETQYVVAGEDAGGKLDKARALNLPVLTEAAWT